MAVISPFAHERDSPVRNPRSQPVILSEAKDLLMNDRHNWRPFVVFATQGDVPSSLVEDRLDGNEPDLQHVAVVDGDRNAGGDALIIDVSAVDGPYFLEHAVVVTALDDLG